MLFFGAKSALVLIFTLIECLDEGAIAITGNAQIGPDFFRWGSPYIEQTGFFTSCVEVCGVCISRV